MPASHVVKAMFCFTAPIWRSLTLLHRASLRTGSSQSSDLTLKSNNFTPSCHHSDLITILLLKSQSWFTQHHMQCVCYKTALQSFTSMGLLFSETISVRAQTRAGEEHIKEQMFGGTEYLSLACDRTCTWALAKPQTTPAELSIQPYNSDLK